MSFIEKPLLNIAILDLYDGQPNQGMRGLHDIIAQLEHDKNIHIQTQVFDVRQKQEVPNLEFDLYISSGGPGDPMESEGEPWDNKYFEWLDTLHKYNQSANTFQKRPAFFICHSFQLACRYFKIGSLTKRKSNSFGVFPIHMLEDGEREPVFDGLNNPFYAVDSRDYQVVEPDYERIQQLGSKILAIEKERPHVPLQRAMMAVRFTDHFIGTQFHPEADPVGMLKHLYAPDKKESVIKNHSLEKWESMVQQLNDPDKILMTYSHVLPNFLHLALTNIMAVSAA